MCRSASTAFATRSRSNAVNDEQITALSDSELVDLLRRVSEELELRLMQRAE